MVTGGHGLQLSTINSPAEAGRPSPGSCLSHPAVVSNDPSPPAAGAAWPPAGHHPLPITAHLPPLAALWGVCGVSTWPPQLWAHRPRDTAQQPYEETALSGGAEPTPALVILGGLCGVHSPGGHPCCPGQMWPQVGPPRSGACPSLRHCGSHGRRQPGTQAVVSRSTLLWGRGRVSEWGSLVLATLCWQWGRGQQKLPRHGQGCWPAQDREGVGAEGRPALPAWRWHVLSFTSLPSQVQGAGARAPWESQPRDMLPRDRCVRG